MSYDIRAIKHNTRNLKEPEGKSSFIIDISEKSQNYKIILLLTCSVESQRIRPFWF